MWRGFFRHSKIGKTYTVLVDDMQRIVMCDTEFEYLTNKKLFDVVNKKCEIQDQVNVLVLGYGIGYVTAYLNNPKIKIHFIEKNQDVLDLTPPQENVTVYIGDVNDFDFTKFGEKKFDVIWSDVTDFNKSESRFKQYLNPMGFYGIWKGHYK